MRERFEVAEFATQREQDYALRIIDLEEKLEAAEASLKYEFDRAETAYDQLAAAEAQNLALIERLESLQFENLTLREAQNPDYTITAVNGASPQPGPLPERYENPDSVVRKHVANSGQSFAPHPWTTACSLGACQSPEALIEEQLRRMDAEGPLSARRQAIYDAAKRTLAELRSPDRTSAK